MNSLRLVVLFHLLATAVLALLTLLLSIRFPYPEARSSFYVTLAVLILSAVTALPLLAAGSLSLLWIPAVAFLAATLSFLLFAVRVIRAHYQRLRRQ